ncbi:TlpA family protein disulfide reductase [Nitrincola iocasae]|uniref:Redoxin domain-containing protein n=1 Tax=Nitrincola iocasae TaxID=2614693 RepID=A0A5J6LFU1_9GAMM|nr:TlpA family protein disulfide reductase [Nitrincola iocasae]QEW07253.1 redoxin domain-containing protein [Nitrincola iocasae]
MRRYYWPLFIVAVLVFGLAVFWGLQQSKLSRSLPDSLVLSNLQGQPVDLNDFQGQPVVINFWATWCPPCIREMPLLASYAEKEGLTLVLINQGETLDVITDYLDSAGLTFEHLLLDPRQAALQAMQVRGLPTTQFFDAQGRLVNEHMGELHDEQLQQFVQHYQQ